MARPRRDRSAYRAVATSRRRTQTSPLSPVAANPPTFRPWRPPMPRVPREQTSVRLNSRHKTGNPLYHSVWSGDLGSSRLGRLSGPVTLLNKVGGTVTIGPIVAGADRRRASAGVSRRCPILYRSGRAPQPGAGSVAGKRDLSSLRCPRARTREGVWGPDRLTLLGRVSTSPRLNQEPYRPGCRSRRVRLPVGT